MDKTHTNSRQKITFCLDDLYRLFDDEHAENTDSSMRFCKKDPYNRLNITSRTLFAKEILPPDIYLVLAEANTAEEVLSFDEKTKKAALNPYGKSRATLSRVFKNEGKNGAKERFRHVVALLTHKTSYNYDTYEKSHYRKDIADRWGILISKLTTSEKKQLKARLLDTVNSFPESSPNCDDIKKRLLVKILDTENTLSSLTLIACTLYIWNDDDPGIAYIAHDIILPCLPEISEADLPSRRLLDENARCARKMLDDIRPMNDTIETSGDSARICYDKCQKILNIHPLDDKDILGETFFILCRCSLNPRFVSPDGTSPEVYLRQSRIYQWPEAEVFDLERKGQSLYESIRHSTSRSKGLCVTNVDLPTSPSIASNINPRLEALFESAPKNWRWKTLSVDFDFSNDPTLPIRYFLFDVSEEKNFNDLLTILDYYKRSWNSYKPYDVEVYLLGNSRQLGNLVDTAQQYMCERIVPVHIINEERRSAQFLLAKHPLFYPVLDYPVKIDKCQKKNLHFIVLGSDECAGYLVQEASWMMTFSSASDEIEIVPKITLVGNNVSSLVDHILSICPGLQDNDVISDFSEESSKKGKTKHATVSEHYSSDLKDIESPFGRVKSTPCSIRAEDVDDYNSIAFDKFLYKCLESDDALYFAVSLGSSTTNLAAAIALREKTIQYYVAVKSESSNVRKTDSPDYLRRMPPIAFRCTDYRIADLSQKLVVSKVDHGDLWFNNHMIIPFGSYYEIFGWNGLVNNLIEQLSQFVHILYASFSDSSRSYENLYQGGQIPTVQDEKDYLQKLILNARETLNDYYRRQYNKDSSFSVALSMPYRLFSCTHSEGEDLTKKDRLTENNSLDESMSEMKRAVSLVNGYIYSTDAFFNVFNLKTLAESVSFLQMNASQQAEAAAEKMAAWEHTRWNRWLISEGWLPASAKCVAYYNKAGSKTDKLFIGKLHPALRSWTKLRKISAELEKLGLPKPDYQRYDLGSAYCTRLLLLGACEMHELELGEQEYSEREIYEQEADMEIDD